MRQTAVEWLEKELEGFCLYRNLTYTQGQELIKTLEQAKEIEKQQQETFAIQFAEWYEKDVLAKGDYEMIDKDKKELLEIFKETYGKQ